jgi:hypothetical protein
MEVRVSLEQQVVGLAILGTSVGAWWLAVRVIFGKRFGPWQWVPVAIVAVCIPVLLADLNWASQSGYSEAVLLAVWFSIAFVIDLTWGVAWLRRRSRKVRARASDKSGGP